ncbi:hypothetical protein [Planctomyces sp. SH-PL62]|uniref:hypothetical protein n=1 Tax=Planctomyces sp. SH-PL62 TaxID=1636152 RepID=UPI00078E1F1F|nr:hypothetical protein [Planctomyces sp. SH-PL62]AMV40909.1 hypothetical protein VT85_25975 [Planctomyces sp. SH-PL62]
MRPHLLILAMTGLLACAGSTLADDKDEWDKGRRGGDYKGFDKDRRDREKEYYKRFEQRRRTDGRFRGYAEPYAREPRGGYYAEPFDGAEAYPPPPSPRVSPYLSPPPGYGPPRTTFDFPGLGRSGLPLPRLEGDIYGPIYPPPSMTYYEVRRPRYEPGLDAQRQVQELSDSLFGQTDSYIRDFAPTAGVVPEGSQFLVEAEALNAVAARFRDLAAGGSGPGRLTAELGNVEAMYGPLVSRTDRIAQGRTGPNIERVHAMGDTIQQLRRLLPLP